MSRTIIALLFALVSHAHAQNDSSLPSITWSASPLTRDTTVRDGLLMVEIISRQDYAKLPYLFFDRGSAAISRHYALLENRSRAELFADTTIPGGTMEKHRSLLDIVGYRLRRHGHARLTITGCSSDERRSGENIEIARRRAETVRDYLVTIHGIDSSRLTVAARLLPSHPSHSDDPRAAEENRRVELASSDPRIGDIVIERYYRVFHTPDTVALHVSNGALDQEVVTRQVEIRRADTVWHTIPLEPHTDTVVIYNWGRNGDRDDPPYDSRPTVVRTIAILRSGRQVASLPVEIPVSVIQEDGARREPPFHGRTDDYCNWFFPFDDATTNAFHRAVIDRDVKPNLTKSTHIILTGHTDDIGEEEYNLRLSERRASAILKLLRSGPTYPSTTYPQPTGVGEDSPLYTNDLPEGRMLNRTVNVHVISPMEE